MYPLPIKQENSPKIPNGFFPKIGIPQNGRFIMENPIKMDDLGGTTIFGNTQIIHLHLERLPAFAGQRCLFIQLQLLEMGAEVTPHRDALPYGGDLIATVVLKGSSEVRVGRGVLWEMAGKRGQRESHDC